MRPFVLGTRRYVLPRHHPLGTTERFLRFNECVVHILRGQWFSGTHCQTQAPTRRKKTKKEHQENKLNKLVWRRKPSWPRLFQFCQQVNLLHLSLPKHIFYYFSHGSSGSCFLCAFHFQPRNQTFIIVEDRSGTCPLPWKLPLVTSIVRFVG